MSTAKMAGLPTATHSSGTGSDPEHTIAMSTTKWVTK